MPAAEILAAFLARHDQWWIYLYGACGHLGQDAGTEALLGELPIPPEFHIVDMGCFIGHTGRQLARRFGCRVTGIDANPEFIATAQRLTEAEGLSDQVRFLCASSHQAPLADGSVDVVMSQEGVWDLDEAARLLRPGGLLLCSTLIERDVGDFCTHLEAKGFRSERVEDITEEALEEHRLLAARWEREKEHYVARFGAEKYAINTPELERTLFRVYHDVTRPKRHVRIRARRLRRERDPSSPLLAAIKPLPPVRLLLETRKELWRVLEGLTSTAAETRLEQKGVRLNSIAWIVGHCALQQLYFFSEMATGQRVLSERWERSASGKEDAPVAYHEARALLKATCEETEGFLRALRPQQLSRIPRDAAGKSFLAGENWAELLQRAVVHTWLHIGQNIAIRRLLGHTLEAFPGLLEGGRYEG